VAYDRFKQVANFNSFSSDNFVTKPTLLSRISHKIKKISAGYNHNAVIDENGRLYLWGQNKYF
jgi:alpha-tubulin suppressor-like RCC1 family protein